MIDKDCRNVLFMSTSFAITWLAFISQSLIEEDAINRYSENGNIPKHAGYISLAICFLAEMFCDPFSAVLVNYLGPKMTMIIGALASAVFTSSFLYINEAVLYITSALFGFGCACLWVGQGNYLALNSNDKTAGKHSAIFFAFFKVGTIVAGILLLAIAKIFNKAEDLSYTSIKILYSAFTIAALLGAVMFAFLPIPTKKDIVQEKAPIEMLKSTLKVFFTKDMIFISLITVYTGVQWGFWLSVFPTCVAFTQKLGSEGNKPEIMAFVIILMGISQTGAALFSIFTSMKLPQIPSKFYIIFALIIQVVMFGVILLIFPRMSSLEKTDEIGIISPSFFLGVGDVLLKSPLFNLIIIKLSGKSAEAFALFNFAGSFTCSACFFYSSYVDLYWQIGILVVTAAIALVCVLLLDRKTSEIEVKMADECEKSHNSFKEKDSNDLID